MKGTQTPAQRVSVNWGERLRNARKGTYSQVQFAELTQFGQTTISRYERGLIPWTPEVMLRFAVALDMEVDRLFPWPVGITDLERYHREVAA